MIPQGKQQAIVRYLTKSKHKFGKYYLEFFNVNVSKNTVSVDLNVIPTENNTSYVYKGFTCSAADIVDEISNFISLDEKVIFEIENLYFNGKPVEPEDFSFSENFISKAESKINKMMGVFKTVKSINYTRAVITFICEYQISNVTSENYSEAVFFATGVVKKFLINDVEQENVPDRLKDLIATYLPYFQEDDRYKIESYLDELLSKDQTIDRCDIDFSVFFDYEDVLGKKPEQGYAHSSDVFFSGVEDFVNGYD
jgi:hypothetical protein